MYLSTKEGGDTQAFPNVCQVPQPVGPPIPAPFPSLGQCVDADGGTCAERVTVRSLDVVKIDAEKNLMLVKGPVPGANKSLVRIRPATRLYKSKSAAAG